MLSISATPWRSIECVDVLFLIGSFLSKWIVPRHSSYSLLDPTVLAIREWCFSVTRWRTIKSDNISLFSVSQRALFTDTHRIEDFEQRGGPWRCSSPCWCFEGQSSKMRHPTTTSSIRSFSSKTLTLLDLESNQIKNEGAESLADALMINRVREFLLWPGKSPVRSLSLLSLESSKAEYLAQSYWWRRSQVSCQSFE